MDHELSGMIRRFTFVLLVLAAAATEIAAVDTRPWLVSVGLASIWVLVAVALGRLARWMFPRAFAVKPAESQANPPRSVLLILITLGVAPFLVEPLRREWTGEGYALELQLVLGLRNLGLGLAAFAAWSHCQRLACVVSLFLMLFTAAMTDHPAALTLLALYAAAGSVWLMLVHWTGLRQFFVAPETAVALEVQPGNESLPWLAVLAVVGLLGCVVAATAAGPQRVAHVLAELLPTSGGTGSYDPFARGGVNDGDEETRGNNARSTGTVETDQFLDSPLPSLYDIANDMYGEPFKPRETERSIALDSRTKAREDDRPPADHLRPNREFPTTRRSPRQPREAMSRSARALFEVQGRTPLHVRVTAYDQFDSRSWKEAPLARFLRPIEKEPHSNWMIIHERTPPRIYAGPASHQFKITDPTGSLIPTPPHLTRFRIGRVDQADFFGWGQDRILRMAQRRTPSGIAVLTECRVPDHYLLETVRFPERVTGEENLYGALPANLSPETRELALRWAGQRRRGWPQIEAVVGRLRSDYLLDTTARVPDDCHDPLGHFLYHSRRGPDYQFATAAAVLLRVLNYRIRVVSGFYVSPANYDPLTRHTPVVKEDLHFWTEVQLPGGDWLVIEPTPGYEVLGPEPTLAEQLWAALAALGEWVWWHLTELALGMCLLAVSWWKWRDWFDAAAVLSWRWFPARTWQQALRRAVWLLEWRGRSVGRGRRANQTVPAWLRGSALDRIEKRTDLDRLGRMAEWASYAPELPPPWPGEEVLSLCERILATCSLKRWREQSRARAEQQLQQGA